jgi:hypothetical protein
MYKKISRCLSLLQQPKPQERECVVSKRVKKNYNNVEMMMIFIILFTSSWIRRREFLLIFKWTTCGVVIDSMHRTLTPCRALISEAERQSVCVCGNSHVNVPNKFLKMLL